MTTSPSFLESNWDDSLDVFALTTFFQDNEGSNQVNNTNQANSRYSVHPVPTLNLQVNNLGIFGEKILVKGVLKINFLIDSGSAINIINLVTFQNLKKVNSKLHLKTTKTVPYRQKIVWKLKGFVIWLLKLAQSLQLMNFMSWIQQQKIF